MHMHQDQKPDYHANDVEAEKKDDFTSDTIIQSPTDIDQTNLDDGEFERRTIRKVDLRLLPILGIMYAFSYIDRSNLPNIAVTGGGVAIGLSSGNHYSIVNLVFFIPYIVLDIPSNIVFRRVGASIFLGTSGLLWGVIQISMGFVNTWSQMAALRVLLGILEAGIFSACVWLISAWYTRKEVQTRLAIFCLFPIIAFSFGNILAYGLSQIRADNLGGWRWILIIEGITTCTLGLLGYLVIIDFPDKNKFLTNEETQFIKERIERDHADVEYDPLTLSKCWEYALDFKMYCFYIAYVCTIIATQAYGYFIILILVGMGYSVKNAQLLIAPTGLFTCLSIITISKASDKFKLRGPFIILQALMAITGLAMTAFGFRQDVRFAGCFIGLAGAHGNVPAILAYQSNNIRRQSKRAFASAMIVMFGGIGAIITPVVFRHQDSPKYRFGMITAISFQGLLIVLVILNSIWFMYRNNQVKKGGKAIEGCPGFLYTL